MRSSGKDFEVVYVPVPLSEGERAAAEDDNGEGGGDQDFESFRGTMPWLSIQLENEKQQNAFHDALTREEMGLTVQACNGPSLYLVEYDGDTPVTINPQATQMVLRERAKGFPWKTPLVRELTQALEDDPDVLERESFVLVFLPSDKAKADDLTKEALAVAEAEQKRGGLAFFTTTTADQTAAEMLGFVGILDTGLTDSSWDAGPASGGDDVKGVRPPFGMQRESWFQKGGAFVMAFTLGSGPAGYVSEKNYCKEDVNISDFVSEWRKGSLKRQEIEAGDPLHDMEMAEEEEDDEEEVDLGSEDTDDD